MPSTTGKGPVLDFLADAPPKLLSVLADVGAEIMDDGEDNDGTSRLGSEIDGMIARITSLVRLRQ